MTRRVRAPSRLEILRAGATREWALMVLAAAAFLSALWWPHVSAQQLPDTSITRLVVSPTGPTGAVEIVGVGAPATTADSGRLQVNIEVRNRSAAQQDARLWWFLSKPGERKPWVDPAEQGTPVDVVVPAGGRADAVVVGPVQSPAGEWNLSLWAHTTTGGEDLHSDGVNVTPFVQVLRVGTDVLRTVEPGQLAALEDVIPAGRLATPAPAGPGREVSARAVAPPVPPEMPDVRVGIRASSVQPVDLYLRCYLATPGTQDPWQSSAAVASDRTHLVVEGTVPVFGGCRFPVLPSKGTWEVSAIVDRTGGSGVPVREDLLFSRVPVQFS